MQKRVDSVEQAGSSGPVGLDHLPGVEQRSPEHGAAGQAYTDPRAPKPTPAERSERMRQTIRARNAARSRRPERQLDAENVSGVRRPPSTD